MITNFLNGDLKNASHSAFDIRNRRLLVTVGFGSYFCFIAFYLLSRVPIILPKQNYGRLYSSSSVGAPNTQSAPGNETTQDESSVLMSKTNASTHKGLPHRFVYHALHKTGSEYTRNQLKALCAESKIDCLTFRACLPDNGQVLVCHFKTDYQAFLAGNQSGLETETGSFTNIRMQKCCPKTVFIKHWYAVNEHMTLADPANQKFINERFPGSDAVRFTIVRDPLAQFVSNYHYVQTNLIGLDRLEQQLNQKQPASKRTQTPVPMPGVEALINKFYKMSNDSTIARSSTQRERRLYAILTNSQSKELGWVEGKASASHQKVVEYLEHIDSVGITAKMPISYRMFKKALGLPPSSKFLTVKPKLARSEDAVKKMSPLLKHRLRFIQRYDMILYNRAKELFTQRCIAGNFGSKQECYVN